MSRVRVNYKSDLPPIGVTFMLGDHEVPVPTTDFVVRFFVEGSPGPSFECIHKGEEYINCEVTSEDTLTCYINNHELGCGRLCCEFIDLSRNVKYADGVQKTVTPTKLDVVLVDGAGDDLVEITESIAIDIETIIGEIREAMEVLDGYADIIAALQAAVATIPDVIDDLETGGHTDALSAEQGKILKEIIDNIGRISVEGIKGFTPISSLNELPENPTTEQKRQAYLFENALYVFVGAGGDTLDGKYQSVELVSLDWGDKSYNTSEFSGLGRRWLKKNMVEGVNVLTAAMISTDNTEYFIQYDYDLDGATVTLPANASLVFMGGSIKNGTLIGNNTRIQAKKGVCIFDGITIQGTWDVTEAYSSWFKTYKAGYKIASVTEDVITLRRGDDGNYYEMEDLTYKSGPYYAYYVTSTLVDGEVVESSIKVTVTTYATFKVEGDDTDYLAAPSLPADVFEEAGYPQFDVLGYAQYDDTAALQSLFDIRAKKTVVEDGVYMIDANTRSNLGYGDPLGLIFDGNNDCELIIEGWLKVIPNGLKNYYALNIIGCRDVRIGGNGGIHGDLLEHTDTSGEGGMLLAVSNTKGMTVENLTFAYAWGDCVYCHYFRHGRTAAGNDQSSHTFNNIKIIYGGRTGLVYERGDNVVVDSCYFMGSGRVRGKQTNSAVDIEPFNSSDAPQRYVMNYEFKNNVFKNSANGLRLERCVNCSVHDNYFDFGWHGIDVIWHKDVSYDITSPSDRGWLKSYLKIYNNQIKRCSTGINLGYGGLDCENVEIYGNTLVSCTNTFGTPDISLINCKIYNNTTYGCGWWQFYSLIDCDIYNNNCYGCKMTEATLSWGANILVYLKGLEGSKRSSFHNNHFSLEYGKSIFGLGEYGKEELYHGLPVGMRYAICNVSANPNKVHFYDNEVSDDLILYWGRSNNFENNAFFRGGISSLRNEDSEVFLENDIFRSTVYGDEGVVTAGGILSCSWLDGAREFEPYMEVAYGEIIKLDTRFAVCNKAGTCGATLVLGQGECGSARFLTVNPYTPDANSANRIKIAFKTRGVCTSETRPDSFLYTGRKMWETDTNKEIVYDGSDWVYNDIYTEE